MTQDTRLARASGIGRFGGRVRQAVTMAAISGFVLVSIGVAGSGAQAAGTPRVCAADALPVPDDVYYSTVVAAGANGRTFTGAGLAESGPPIALLWVDGSVRKLTGPDLGMRVINLWTTDVNSSGLVVGRSVGEDGFTKVAWVYSPAEDRYTTLSLPDGRPFTPMGINDDGMIVADIDWPQETPLIGSVDDPDGFRILPAPEFGRVSDISETGVILGSIYSIRGSFAYVWPDANSRGTRLTNPSGSQDNNAHAVSNNGTWISGFHRDAGSGSQNQVGVRWNLPTGAATEIGVSDLVDVNNHGDLLVNNRTVPGARTVLRGDGTTSRLPSLFDGGNTNIGVLLDRETDITAAGGSFGAGRRSRATVWSGC